MQVTRSTCDYAAMAVALRHGDELPCQVVRQEAAVPAEGVVVQGDGAIRA